MFKNLPKPVIYILPYVYWLLFAAILTYLNIAYYGTDHAMIDLIVVAIGSLFGMVITNATHKYILSDVESALIERHNEAIGSIAKEAAMQVGTAFFDTVSDGIINLIKCDYVMISELSYTVNGQPFLQAHAIHNSEGKMNNIRYEVSNLDLIKIAGIENRRLGDELMAPPEEMFDDIIKEHIATPLISSKGAIIGVLSCMWRAEKKKDDTIRPILQIFSGRCSAELERMITEDKLFYKANFDALTKLPNRGYMISDIEDIITSLSEPENQLVDRYHVYFIDLDDFKEINDEFGHEAGDILLKEIATRLKTCVQPNDVVARLGGDEFVIIEHRRNHYPENTADRIIDNLSKIVKIDSSELSVTASVGYVAVPGDTQDPDEILKYADFAMYRAKDLGKNKHVKFTHEIFNESRTEKSMERMLIDAIDNKTIDIVIQPIVEKGIDTLVKGEVLARWEFDGEPVSPEIFITLAERRGLINGLGKVVFEKAVEYCGKIKKEHNMEINLAINCSTIQLKDPNFINFAIETAKEHDVSPRQITLEITETVMSSEDSLMASLVSARALGFTIAIDDFGTGYSSISFLEQLPIHIVKVDRSLVDGVGNDKKMQIVLESIANICKVYKYKLIAEGVETSVDFDYLKSVGYDMIQGYYISKPLTLDKYLQQLRSK